MADISTDRNGNRRLRFYELCGGERVRKGFRIGKLDKKTAERLCEDVEALLVAKMTGQPMHPSIAERIGRLGTHFRKKLEGAGLLAPLEPQKPKATLEAFLSAYIEGRGDLKASTKDNLAQAKAALIEFFGARTALADITPGGADDFRLWLQTKRKRPLATNTANRLCSRAKQFFRHAFRKRLIAENPFADMRGLAVRGNPERLRNISPETTDRLLAACPDSDWRLLIVLCRYGGMRPSEACSLRWEHVDWERSRIRVQCKKTEHHQGREWREVPIFPELKQQLIESWDAAPEGSDMVIRRYRKHKNLRTEFYRLMERAGIEKYPKPFQNLRSTRETELMRRFPEHVVYRWLGNTQQVAREHYLQVTDEDFQRAVALNAEPVEAARSGGGCPSLDGVAISGPKSGPERAGTDGLGRNRAKPTRPSSEEMSGPDESSRSSALGADQRTGEGSSPSRIRTYNLAVNSRSLYR